MPTRRRAPGGHSIPSQPPDPLAGDKPCKTAKQQSVDQAAVNHIDVSNALLISGMFVPKFALAAALLEAFAGFSGLSITAWANSARSPGPRSRERATEKNRST
jgi:hypothetical protein